MMQLYFRTGCPFCAKVQNALDNLELSEGSDYEIINSDPGTEGREEAVKLGGKAQFPLMVDADTIMYESDDIIEYIEGKFSSAFPESEGNDEDDE